MAKKSSTKSTPSSASGGNSPFNHIQHPKKRAYLVAFANCGNMLRACKLAKIDRSSQWHWSTEDPEFAEAQAVAKKMACDLIEAEIERRAIEGTLKPIYRGGRKVGIVREYSDTLLIFMAKGAMPQKYRDNASLQVSGVDGGPLEIVATLNKRLGKLPS